MASAEGVIGMAAATLAMIENGEHRKGDVLAVARLAGIQAAKHTALLIPLCHTILITGVQVDFEIMPDKSCIKAIATVKTTGQTGVEMEALTAVNVALLTIYDMCKAVDRGMIMRDIAC